MAGPHQQLRPSQFITTYGPGGIVETRSGPVVILSMDRLFRDIGRDPEHFEVFDDRLSRSLGGARIARLPSNAELEVEDDTPIYPTARFPEWSLCTHHGADQILYRSADGCPLCQPLPFPARRSKAGREAIRFVLACPQGHLDDVNWHRVVHPQDGRCRPNHFVWRGGGHALRFVTLDCPDCGSTENFGRAYGRPWICTARHPELGPAPQGTTCPAQARIFQRGASNLRVASVEGALTILEMPARTHHVLRDRAILGVAALLRRRGELTQQMFLGEMRELHLPQMVIDFLSGESWEDVRGALEQLLDHTASTRPLRDEEFERLVDAAANGAPPVPSGQPGAPPLFEVRRSDVRTLRIRDRGSLLRVTPVSRLRMVLVQTGYQRVDPATGRMVSTRFTWGVQDWLPGIELFGEGIFVDVAEHRSPLHGARAEAWRTRQIPQGTFPHPIDPEHVWWHTLSHRLVRALSIDSGYSSAAIRERVYLTRHENGESRGGVLLYTVQPGGDGTLGGLISLAGQFGEVLDGALTDLATCSNDPLCEEAPTAGADGSACYSCLLVSETSCEFRNLGLDRLLLVENPL